MNTNKKKIKMEPWIREPIWWSRESHERTSRRCSRWGCIEPWCRRSRAATARLFAAADGSLARSLCSRRVRARFYRAICTGPPMLWVVSSSDVRLLDTGSGSHVNRMLAFCTLFCKYLCSFCCFNKLYFSLIV